MQLFIFSLLLLGLYCHSVSLSVVPPAGVNGEVKLERGHCPLFWYSFNGRCYKYVASPMSWGQAELHCVSQKANLVSILSREENDFVRTLIQNSDPQMAQTWIGINDLAVEGGWVWSDGSPVAFTQWAAEEPNNGAGSGEHCGNTNETDEKKWNDMKCHEQRAFVCATRAGCPE